MARTSGLITHWRDPKKETSFEERNYRAVPDRCRSGYGTQVRVIADGHEKVSGFADAPEQTHELPLAPGTLGNLPAIPRWDVAEKRYASDVFRKRIREVGGPIRLFHETTRWGIACPKKAQQHRHLVESLLVRIKKSRTVAPRYIKTARSFLDATRLSSRLNTPVFLQIRAKDFRIYRLSARFESNVEFPQSCKKHFNVKKPDCFVVHSPNQRRRNKNIKNASQPQGFSDPPF